jgi:hypothetical protein
MTSTPTDSRLLFEHAQSAARPSWANSAGGIHCAKQEKERGRGRGEGKHGGDKEGTKGNKRREEN